MTASMGMPSDGCDIERIIRDLASKLYTHHVIRYDPEAEERCILEAATAFRQPLPVTQGDEEVVGVLLARATADNPPRLGDGYCLTWRQASAAVRAAALRSQKDEEPNHAPKS